METVTTSLLETINDGIDDVLSGAASLLLPTLDHFPVVATAVSFFLPVGGVRARGRTNETVGYVELYGDLGLRTLYRGEEDSGEESEEGDGEEDGDGEESEDGDGEDNDGEEDRSSHENKENHCAVATSWAEEYRDNPNAVVSCTYDTRASTTATRRRDSADAADTSER